MRALKEIDKFLNCNLQIFFLAVSEQNISALRFIVRLLHEANCVAKVDANAITAVQEVSRRCICENVSFS